MWKGKTDLKRILKAIMHNTFPVLVAVGIVNTVLVVKSAIEEKNKQIKRLKIYNDLESQWLYNKMKEIDISSILREKGISSVAVYGCGTLGDLLFDDLKNASIEVPYRIDMTAAKQPLNILGELVIGIDKLQDQKPVDAIIVTPVFAFDSIKKDLEKSGVSCDIICLSDLLFVNN